MGISPFQLLIVLVIVVLIFGGKRLRTLGSDLGHAIKGFKDVTKDDKDTLVEPKPRDHIEYEAPKTDSQVIDVEVQKDKNQTL